MASQKTEYEKIEEALEDKYKIDGMVGKGAFGQVYKANCKEDGEKYAIKIMALAGNQENMKYQHREVELLTRIKMSKGSNVIKYFKSWLLEVSDGVRFVCIQMELCSVNLETFVNKNSMDGPKIIQAQGPPRFYQQVFQQILNGLVFIHSIGWVHRDIHPGNILIANPNPKQINDILVKIADFGLARYIGMEFDSSPETEWRIKGKFQNLTPLPWDGPWKAPELLNRSATYDFKVDIYSIGMVLYFISRYPVQESSKLKSEVEALQQGINECLCHKDDKKLSKLITFLLQPNPNVRPSAREAQEFMFPTEAKDSTDSSGASTTEFFARKDDEEDLSGCFLKEFTLSAMKEAVTAGTGVETDRQDLLEERMVNGVKKRIKIGRDENVKAAFQRAVANNGDVEVVVREQPREDNQDSSESL